MAFPKKRHDLSFRRVLFEEKSSPQAVKQDFSLSLEMIKHIPSGQIDTQRILSFPKEHHDLSFRRVFFEEKSLPPWLSNKISRYRSKWPNTPPPVKMTHSVAWSNASGPSPAPEKLIRGSYLILKPWLLMRNVGSAFVQHLDLSKMPLKIRG